MKETLCKGSRGIIWIIITFFPANQQQLTGLIWKAYGRLPARNGLKSQELYLRLSTFRPLAALKHFSSLPASSVEFSMHSEALPAQILGWARIPASFV